MECPICLEIFDTNDDIIQMSCCIAHYHKECVYNWILIKKTCPCCRSELVLNRGCSYYIFNLIILIIFVGYICVFTQGLAMIMVSDDTLWKSMVLFLSFFFVVSLILSLRKRIFNRYNCDQNFTIKAKLNG